MIVKIITLSLVLFFFCAESSSYAQQPPSRPMFNPPPSGIATQEIMDKAFQLGYQVGQEVVNNNALRERAADEKIKWILDNWVPKGEYKK